MESEDSTVGLKMTSKGTYATVCLPGLLLPMPRSIRAYQHMPPQETLRLSWICLWVSILGHCSFPLGPGVYKVLFVSSKCLYFLQSCENSVIKSH